MGPGLPAAWRESWHDIYIYIIHHDICIYYNDIYIYMCVCVWNEDVSMYRRLVSICVCVAVVPC
jgi:hypothetical protein